MTNTILKKITRATIKSFIQKNEGKLLIKTGSRFNGMTDGIEEVKDEFSAVVPTETMTHYNLGISGAWFVGNSRDHFTHFETEELIGFEVSNCCGDFTLAIKK